MPRNEIKDAKIFRNISSGVCRVSKPLHQFPIWIKSPSYANNHMIHCDIRRKINSGKTYYSGPKITNTFTFQNTEDKDTQNNNFYNCFG
jgi:hypothetical protein